jgi:hypothetical protein
MELMSDTQINIYDCHAKATPSTCGSNSHLASHGDDLLLGITQATDQSLNESEHFLL